MSKRSMLPPSRRSRAPGELGRETCADRDRQAGPDYAEGADQTAIHVGQVHRPAEPAADARLAPEQFGEGAFEVHPAGEAMAVAAIGVGHVVIVAERL